MVCRCAHDRLHFPPIIVSYIYVPWRMLSGKLGVFVLVQFLELRFRSGERTRLACCRWRLANDFSMLNKKYFGEAPKSAREARALPGKDASLRAANVRAERSASAKI